MKSIELILKEQASQNKLKFTKQEDDKFCVDIAMNLNDGTVRYQYVWLWITEGRGKGKNCIYLSSRAGKYNPDLNLYQLIKETGYGIYSTITLVDDKDRFGNPCESIVVQASPVESYLSEEEFLFILWEVAEVADIIEEKYFGFDNY